MKYIMTYDQKQCSGCRQCQLACSRKFDKQFQPSRSRIRLQTQGDEFYAVFTDDCVKCGICADSCLFGALTKNQEGAI
ncbi:MAG: 4Fe-4S binding protein [Desulfobacteraceae bacterium]|nr:4Fe-4S binding protein [Desulfobacteraceae bacterium]